MGMAGGREGFKPNRAQRRLNDRMARRKHKADEFKTFVRILKTPKLLVKLNMQQLIYARKILISRLAKHKQLFKILDKAVIARKKVDKENEARMADMLKMMKEDKHVHSK